MISHLRWAIERAAQEEAARAFEKAMQLYPDLGPEGFHTTKPSEQIEPVQTAIALVFLAQCSRTKTPYLISGELAYIIESWAHRKAGLRSATVSNGATIIALCWLGFRLRREHAFGGNAIAGVSKFSLRRLMRGAEVTF
jgi:hypothetical protein